MDLVKSPYRRAPGSGTSNRSSTTPRVAPRTPTTSTTRPLSAMPTSGSAGAATLHRTHPTLGQSGRPAAHASTQQHPEGSHLYESAEPRDQARALAQAFARVANEAMQPLATSSPGGTILRPRSRDPLAETHTNIAGSTAGEDEPVHTLIPRRAPNSGSNRPRPTPAAAAPPPAATAVEFTQDGYAIPMPRTPSHVNRSQPSATPSATAAGVHSQQARPNSQSQLPLSSRERQQQQQPTGERIAPRRLPFTSGVQVAPLSSPTRYAPSMAPAHASSHWSAHASPHAHIPHSSRAQTHGAFFDMLRSTPTPRALMAGATGHQNSAAQHYPPTAAPPLASSPYSPLSPSPYSAAAAAPYGQQVELLPYRPMSSEPFPYASPVAPSPEMRKPIPRGMPHEEKTSDGSARGRAGEVPMSGRGVQHDGHTHLAASANSSSGHGASSSSETILTFTDWWIEFHHPKLMFRKESATAAAASSTTTPSSQRRSVPELNEFVVHDVRSLAALPPGDLVLPSARDLVRFVPWVVLKGYRLEPDAMTGGVTKSTIVSHSSAICTRHSRSSVSTMSGRRYALHGGPDAQAMKLAASHWSPEVRAAFLEEGGFPDDWKELLWKATVGKVREEMAEKGEIDLETQRTTRPATQPVAAAASSSSRRSSASASGRKKRVRTPSPDGSTPSDEDERQRQLRRRLRRTSRSGGSTSEKRSSSGRARRDRDEATDDDDRRSASRRDRKRRRRTSRSPSTSRSRSRSRERDSRSRSRSRSPKRRSHRSPTEEHRSRHRASERVYGSGSSSSNRHHDQHSRRRGAPLSASMHRMGSSSSSALKASVVRSRSLERAPSMLPEHYHRGVHSSLSTLSSHAAVSLGLSAPPASAPAKKHVDSSPQKSAQKPRVRRLSIGEAPGKSPAKRQSAAGSDASKMSSAAAAAAPSPSSSGGVVSRSGRQPVAPIAWWNTSSSLSSLPTRAVSPIAPKEKEKKKNPVLMKKLSTVKPRKPAPTAAPASPVVVRWTAGEVDQLLAYHSNFDASSPTFWADIAVALDRPGKDAAECAKRWQAHFVGTPIAPPEGKDALNKRKKPTAKKSGKGGAKRPKTTATDGDDLAGAGSASAASGSPDASAAGPAARTRAPPKPTVRALVAQFAATSSTPGSLPPTAGVAAADQDADEDDLFDASPFKALRQRERDSQATDADQANDAPAKAEQPSDTDEAAAMAAPGGKKASKKKTTNPTKSTRGKKATSTSVADQQRLLLQKSLRTSDPQADADGDVPMEEAADGSPVDGVAPGSAATSTGDLSSAFLVDLPDRSKTDAYVQRVQRLTRATKGAAATTTAQEKRAAAKLAMTSAGAPAGLRQPTGVHSALHRQITRELRQGDARRTRHQERLEDEDQMDEAEGGPDNYFGGDDDE